ncbi:thioredoxin domain-containing protein [Streptomyces griseus]|uniref:DsbA family protein n=1 Tax=Streptomyces griseus TaxID=1911 RepID=UPI000AC4207C|nr:thioredoxin domain-containing protein [Streptomyces griseus]
MALVLVTIAVQSGRTGDDRPVVPPAGATGDDGLIIPSGRADAPVTMAVYEDPRCPGCAQFERQLHRTFNKLEDEGKLRVEYHILSFVDRIAPGKGSRYAAGALAAAQDAGKFRAFHDLLFASQPSSEKDDVFGDKEVLLALGEKTEGLDMAKFTAAVREGTHDGWVKKVQRAFDQQEEIQATPAVIFEGKDLIRDAEHPLTPQRLTDLVEAGRVEASSP